MFIKIIKNKITDQVEAEGVPCDNETEYIFYARKIGVYKTEISIKNLEEIRDPILFEDIIENYPVDCFVLQVWPDARENVVNRMYVKECYVMNDSGKTIETYRI